MWWVRQSWEKAHFLTSSVLSFFPTGPWYASTERANNDKNTSNIARDYILVEFPSSTKIRGLLPTGIFFSGLEKEGILSGTNWNKPAIFNH